MYIPIVPSASGSLPASSPSRKGVEHRFEAAEDPFADRLAARLFGIAAQGRDAVVAGRQPRRPAPDALPGADHAGRPPWAARMSCGGPGDTPRPEVFVTRKHIWLLGDPQTAGQRAATSRPPPGQPRRLPREPCSRPSARERVEVLRDRPNHAYAPAGKTVSHHSRAATAACPGGHDRALGAGARHAESRVVRIAMTYSQGTVSGGVNNRLNGDVQRVPEPSERGTGRHQRSLRRHRPTGALCGSGRRPSASSKVVRAVARNS